MMIRVDMNFTLKQCSATGIDLLHKGARTLTLPSDQAWTTKTSGTCLHDQCKSVKPFWSLYSPQMLRARDSENTARCRESFVSGKIAGECKTFSGAVIEFILQLIHDFHFMLERDMNGT